MLAELIKDMNFRCLLQIMWHYLCWGFQIHYFKPFRYFECFKLKQHMDYYHKMYVYYNNTGPANVSL